MPHDKESNVTLSSAGAEAIASYERHLREHEDLSAPTLRNYLSDLRHFAAWYEGREEWEQADPGNIPIQEELSCQVPTHSRPAQ